jgi:hypothetical protein
MHYAPLNFDKMFKKVFSNKRIAKRFLEDLLGIKIKNIQAVGIEYKLTDDAVVVKFDYYCTIDGKPVIIEMQQHYKNDVVKRFYLYHCVSTTLQLEALKPVVITRPNGKSYKEKDYSGLKPVLTVVWMVDDALNFDDDLVVFTTLPEATKDFIADETLWVQPLETIVAARSKALKILKNKTKGLDFLQENKLIYFLQGNAAKSKDIKPYTKWAIVAENTKNPNNKESDFDAFKNDKIMAEVLRRLEIRRFNPTEADYVSDLYQYENMLDIKQQEYLRVEQAVVRAEQEAARSQQEAARSQQEAARSQQEAERSQQEAEREKKRAEKVEKKRRDELSNAVKAFIVLGKDVPYIAGVLGLTIDETSAFAQQN